MSSVNKQNRKRPRTERARHSRDRRNRPLDRAASRLRRRRSRCLRARCRAPTERCRRHLGRGRPTSISSNPDEIAVREWPAWACARSRLIESAHVLQVKMSAVQSSLEVRIRRLSGLNDPELTASVWKLAKPTTWFVRQSQTRVVPSLPPAAIHRPFALKEASVSTVPVVTPRGSRVPCRCASSRPARCGRWRR